MEYLNLIIDKLTIANAIRVWNYVMTSNLFNFAFFAAIFILIFKKINVKQIISSIQEKVISLIAQVKKDKEEALKALENAHNTVKKLPEELDEITKDAEKSAEVISEKILNEAKLQVDTIKNNAQKTIEAEERLIIANLTKEATKTSIEQARKQIQWQILKDLSLHEKYINDSIDELDRLKF